jgi:serine/threonine protein kinase
MLGKTIGNYRNAGELAQGGMGSVYRGRHQSLPREVVVKSVLFSSFPPQAQDHLKKKAQSQRGRTN